MMSRMRHVFAAAIFVLCLILTAAAASSDANGAYTHHFASTPPMNLVSVALPNAPRPRSNSIIPGALVPSVTLGDHTHLYDTNDAISLSNLVHVADNRLPGEDIMKAVKWQGKATLEVTMFSDTVNACGNVTGPALYNAIWQILNVQCPTKIGNNDLPPCWDGATPIPIRRKAKLGQYGDQSNCQLRVVHSHFGNAAARMAMFGALAATYEAVTRSDMNCYTVKDHEFNGRYCNVPVQASVFTEGKSFARSVHVDLN